MGYLEDLLRLYYRCLPGTCSQVRSTGLLELEHLATLCKNRVLLNQQSAIAFDQYTLPTPVQERAFQLLGVSPRL